MIDRLQIHQSYVYTYDSKMSLHTLSELHNLSSEDNQYGEILKRMISPLSRGDIISTGDTLVIWDGEHPITLPSDSYNIPSSFLVGDEFLATHWESSLPDYSVWIDIPAHRDELLENLSCTGTYFTTTLGTFHINVGGHSLLVAQQLLRSLITDAESPISFIPTGNYSVEYTCDIYAELAHLYPKYTISTQGLFFVLTSDTDKKYFYYDGIYIRSSSYEQYSTSTEKSHCGNECCMCEFE
jgi:hypothetical protein